MRERARGGGFGAFEIASSLLPVRRRRRRFLFQGKGGFAPVLLFSTGNGPADHSPLDAGEMRGQFARLVEG